ncbi:MAG: Na/Pi cotransporter family protein [Candidatus Gallimonas sp.]
MSTMDYVEIVMKIFGGLGAFLIGMNSLSDNMTRLAHGRLRSMLNKTSKSRFAGVGIGAGVTMIAQSSALTTVMVVGLVNAGIMTLFQATAIIMGANIGTTITAWLVSLNTFDVTTFALGLTAVGVFMTMFSKKEKLKSVGSALAGLGLIFVGLTFMSEAMSFDRNKSPEMYDAVSSLLIKIHNPALLLLIGIAITALVQSSSAVTAIIITMAGQGLIIGGGGNAVLYVIIGSNIGTCVTALLSSIGASTNARRAAVIHFLFNVFGALIFTVFLLAWRGFSDAVLVRLFPTLPEFQIATFHTFFNVICTLLFIPFINIFVKLSHLIVPDGKARAVQQDTPIIELDDRLLRQPSIALGRLYQETGKVFAFSMKTLSDAFQAFLEKNVSVKEEILADNAKLAQVNRAVVEYLVKLSASSLVMEDEKTISSLHYVYNDIERLGELADNITKYTNHYVNDNLDFSGEVISMLREMFDKIRKLYDLSLDAFLNRDFAALRAIDGLEDEIDKARKRLVSTHIDRLNEGKCQPQNSSVFINLVGNLERAADHITFIAHSIEQAE